MTSSCTLKSPSLILPLLDNGFVFCGHGVFNLSGPHLEKTLGFTQDCIGYAFMIDGITCMFATITVGFVCECN